MSEFRVPEEIHALVERQRLQAIAATVRWAEQSLGRPLTALERDIFERKVEAGLDECVNRVLYGDDNAPPPRGLMAAHEEGEG